MIWSKCQWFCSLLSWQALAKGNMFLYVFTFLTYSTFLTFSYNPYRHGWHENISISLNFSHIVGFSLIFSSCSFYKLSWIVLTRWTTDMLLYLPVRLQNVTRNVQYTGLMHCLLSLRQVFSWTFEACGRCVFSLPCLPLFFLKLSVLCILSYLPCRTRGKNLLYLCSPKHRITAVLTQVIKVNCLKSSTTRFLHQWNATEVLMWLCPGGSVLEMWIPTFFHWSSGLGSSRFMVGLDLKDLFQPKWFCGSMWAIL